MIRCATLLLLASLLSAAPVAAVGFQQDDAPDPGKPDIALGIWYPSDAPVSDLQIELLHQMVATEGAVTPGQYPLIIISHGQGGSFSGHYDTAVALAEAGYVVVALTHTGDNWRDDRGAVNINDRPRQVSRVLDYMLSGWPDHGSVDPARVGIFGFSAGGYTALVAAGGHADLHKVRPFCATHADQFTCRLVAAHAGDPAAPPEPAVADPRIKAVVAAAPALGFAFPPDGLKGVTVPVQLWRADNDSILPAPDYADAVRTALPSPPDFQTVAGADHFDFLAPCNDALAARVPMICRDAPDFDRTAFHRRMNAAIVAFFNQALH